jgi:hypothetical protein
VANNKKLIVLFNLIKINYLDISLALRSRLDLASLGLFLITVYSYSLAKIVLVLKAATNK